MRAALTCHVVLVVDDAHVKLTYDQTTNVLFGKRSSGKCVCEIVNDIRT